MKKIFLLYLLLQNPLIKLTAQNSLPPAFEIKTDTVEWDVIGSPYYQMLEDKEGKWTIDQIIQSPIINNFHDSAKNIDSKVNVYWFRYSLKNTMDREALISLNSMSDFDDFYILDSTKKWEHFLSGKMNEWDKKDGLKKADCIPYPLQAGAEILIYQRIRNSNAGLPKDFGLAVLSTNKVLQNYYVKEMDDSSAKGKIFIMNHLLESFFMGFLLFASLFNLFYFQIVRERVYLYFSLFLFFLAINRGINISYAYFSVNDPRMVSYLQYLYLAWIFISFFLIHFIRYFFKTYLVYKRWDRFLIGISIIYILILVLGHFINEQTSDNAGIFRIFQATRSYIFLLLCLPLLITLFLYLPQSRYNLFTRLMIIGAFPLLFFYSLESSLIILSGQNNIKGIFKVISELTNTNFRLIEMLCMGWFVLFSSRILFLRYSKLQKDNVQQALDKEILTREKALEKSQIIEQQKVLLEKQVEERTSELKQSLQNLKATQSQLIQAEKMASLGELTAGIAHEIQNPLNFVNNFSEVNREMLEELKAERLKANAERDDDLQNDLINDVISNSEKINHHGKRADAIVKGMLAHSRTSSGKKEPTDLNALAEEYLRLAYHGLKAKDASFSASFHFEPDYNLPKVNVIPQDIGRVLLNLINNAFQAVSEKQRTEGPDYVPEVKVSTKLFSPQAGGLKAAEIVVNDNGPGISNSIKEKIFQPFFTTKPTGEGTGLGLSLSYDIVKAHGGELKVETKVGEGSTFIISLPVV